jgi:hypothetical protein
MSGSSFGTTGIWLKEGNRIKRFAWLTHIHVPGVRIISKDVMQADVVEGYPNEVEVRVNEVK